VKDRRFKLVTSPLEPMAPKPLAGSASKSTGRKSSKKVPTTKQPLPVPEQIRRLFTSLCAQIDGAHFKNAVKTCDKILRLEPEDKDAAQTKLFLLLQTEQYASALALIDSGDQYAFERAYSLYRLQRELDSVAVLASIKDKGEASRGVIHLEAQLVCTSLKSRNSNIIHRLFPKNYRQGNFQTAFDLYNQLLDTAEPQSEEHSDILTNLQASQKHLEFINTGYMRGLDDLPVSIRTSLESAPPPQPASLITAQIQAPGNLIHAEDSTPGKAVKKVRMSRVPTGVIPGVTPPPDPERWLKKSERSTFAQGGRRRKGAGGGATQGSATPESAPTISQGARSTAGKSKKKK
jgi:signal recognition particle subunit SRP72